MYCKQTIPLRIFTKDKFETNRLQNQLLLESLPT